MRTVSLAYLFCVACELSIFKPNVNERWPSNWDSIWVPYVYTHTHMHSYILRETYIYYCKYQPNICSSSKSLGRISLETRSLICQNKLKVPSLTQVMLLFPSAITPSFWVCFAARFLSENSQYCERPRNYMHSLYINETIFKVWDTPPLGIRRD